MRLWLIVSVVTFGGFANASVPSTNSPPQGQESALQAILGEDLIRSIRDPFQVPPALKVKVTQAKAELEAYLIKDLKLNGVITGPKKVRAMIMAPNNKTYFVKVGDPIGAREGHVSKINEDSIQVMEHFIDEHGKRLPDEYEIKMNGEIISLNKNQGE